MDSIDGGRRGQEQHKHPNRPSIPRKPVPRRSSPDRNQLAAFAASTHGINIDAPENPLLRAYVPSRDVNTSIESLLTPPSQPTPPKGSPVIGVEKTSENERPYKYGMWRPKWLQPIVLGAFAFIFLSFAVALAFMLWYSRERNGIVETRQNLVYLWRFGPTAVLTLLAVFWARVELQAMRHMPWMAMRYGQTLGKDGFSLDYTSMLSPAVLVQSLLHKHYPVFLTAVAAFLLKVQIVLAPGLYSLATIGSPHNISLQLLDTFNVDYIEGVTRETGSYYTSRAIMDYDMLYPFGASRTAAYQTFSQTDGPSRGTSAAPVTAIVDGLFSDIQCITLKSNSVTETVYTTGPSLQVMTTVYSDITFEGCDSVFSVVNDKVGEPSLNVPVDWSRSMTLNQTVPPELSCPNLPQQFPQFLFWSAQMKRSATNSTRLYVDKGAGVLCSPRAWLSKVQVVDDGLNPTVTALRGHPKIPIAANPWRMLYRSIPFVLGGSSGRNEYEGDTWGPIQADAMFWSNKFDMYNVNYFDSEYLYRAITNLTESLGPFLGHYLVREEGTSEAAGATLLSSDRLVVNQWVCITMMVIFSLVACVAFGLLVRYRRRTAVWYRNPASVLGNMIFFHDHPEFANRVAESSLVDNSLAWSRCFFSPLVLRRWARASFTLFVASLIAGLLFTLRRSESSQGLATVSEEGYWHLVWTSFPALVALGVSIYVNSCDWAYRDLATLHCLSFRPCSTKELDSSLQDMMGLRALYYSVRRRILAVSFAQLLAIICGFLTTFVAIIFSVETVPEHTAIQVSQQSWFGAQIDPVDDAADASTVTRGTLSSLLVRQDEANFTYPSNTYNDLVFPNLGGLEQLQGKSNKSVKLTVPAAQTQSNCARVPDNQYTMTYSTYLDTVTYYVVTIDEPFICNNQNRTQANMTQTFIMNRETYDRGKAYFGVVMKSPENLRETLGLCGLETDDHLQSLKDFTTKTKTYVWGEYSVEKAGVESLSVWKCNYTIAKVDTEINMVNVKGQLMIDTETPPKPDLSTSRAWDPPIHFPRASADLGPLYPELIINDTLKGQMDEEFTSMVQPYGPFSLDVFGDPAAEDKILGRLNRDFDFIQAQLINLESRLGLSQRSKYSSPPASLPLMEGVVTDTGRRRLMQNRPVTYIVIAILATVVLLNLLALVVGSRGHVFDMDTCGLAPDGHSSVESMVSLLQGSNAREYLPDSADLLSDDELHGQLSNVGFRLGWFQRWDGERFFTIGALGDHGFEFMGSKREYEKERGRGRGRGRRATYDTLASFHNGKRPSF